MTFSFSRLRDKHGVSVKKPVVQSGVTLDIDRRQEAYVFLENKPLAKMTVMEFEAHAMGLFLRGVESPDGAGLKLVYQEWFLKYEVAPAVKILS
jgi:hypothetical protein